MGRFYKFCVAKFRAHPLREERLNLAIIVFKDDCLAVYPGRRMEKLKAISAALDLDEVRESVLRLTDLDSFARRSGAGDPSARREHLAALGAFEFSDIGEFIAPNDDVYHGKVDDLLKILVEPEPAPAPEVRKKPTKLLRSIKNALRAQRILARKGEGLEAHRVVSNHKLAEGLTADLLLQNGALHVVETVDAVAEMPVRRMITDVAISALVFEQARMSFGENTTETQLVYRAAADLEPTITPSLLAAEHQGAQLVNWASGEDQRRFLTQLASLAEPLEIPAQRSANIHASTQGRFKLH